MAPRVDHRWTELDAWSSVLSPEAVGYVAGQSPLPLLLQQSSLFCLCEPRLLERVLDADVPLLKPRIDSMLVLARR